MIKQKIYIIEKALENIYLNINRHKYLRTSFHKIGICRHIQDVMMYGKLPYNYSESTPKYFDIMNDIKIISNMQNSKSGEFWWFNDISWLGITIEEWYAPRIEALQKVIKYYRDSYTPTKKIYCLDF